MRREQFEAFLVGLGIMLVAGLLVLVAAFNGMAALAFWLELVA